MCGTAAIDEAARALPVTVVAGFGGAGKTALIDHWLRTRPAGERWALLANASALAPPGAAQRLLAADSGRYRVLGGCACCTAQASARSAIVGLLRNGPWERLIVELDGAAHPAALVDLLRRAPFATLLEVDGIVTVVDGVRPTPFETEPMHELARAQIEVSTRIVVNRADCLPGPRRAALRQRLADAPPFGRPVESIDQAPAGHPGPTWHGLSEVAELSAASGSSMGGGAAAGIAVAGSAPGKRLDWRCPASQVFDRARLQALVTGWATRLPLVGAVGVFRTERDWYLWRFHNGRISFEACAYRRENRLQIVFSVIRNPASRDVSIETDLAGARIGRSGDAPHSAFAADRVR